MIYYRIICAVAGILAFGYIGYSEGWQFTIALFVLLWSNNASQKDWG
jgi:hypothetical protein